jgi:uncharacterized protein (DUF2147 family)
MMKHFFIFCLILVSFSSFSQTIEGIWETYDYETGELESDVKLYIKEGRLYGKIIKYHNADETKKNKKCALCNDYRKNQTVLGMIFLNGLKPSGKEWTGEEVLLDPDNGKEYDGKVWLVNDDKLALRGYLGWLYQTHYWTRKK